MVRAYNPGSGKNVLAAVVIVALLRVAGAVALSLWSAGQMQETVKRQFNEEQLVIARHVANLIERELKVLKREILIITKEMSPGPFHPEILNKSIQKTFARVKLPEEFKKISPRVSVVVMTAYGTIESAVEAIQKGAYDFITKPFQRQRILLTIDKVMQWHEIIGENLALCQALAEKGVLSSMIGSTPVMAEIFERIRQVAPTTATVLITGASGTGKELSGRDRRPEPRAANQAPSPSPERRAGHFTRGDAELDAV